MPQSCTPVPMVTLDTMAMEDMVDTTDTVLDTDMDTMDSVTLARGPLMPNPRLMLMLLLMLTTDTTAVDTVTDTDSDMVDTMVDTTDTPMLDMDTVISARGLLMPSPRLMPLLMLTTDTTAVDTDTVMAVTTVDTTDIPDTVMAVDTTGVRLSKSCLC